MRFKVLAIGIGSAALLVADSVGVTAADRPPPPKPVAPDGSSTNSVASNRMIIKNPDGTFTIQKKRANRNSKDAKVKDGLVIPAQVIAPEFPVSNGKR
jgi:hypothetical protein